MPDLHLDLSEADLALLERVMHEQGLPSIEAAAEWLVKMRLRRAARAVAGRGRVLRLVDRKVGPKVAR